MPNVAPWQYIPTEVLDDQARVAAAKDWADEQRGLLAQQWSDLHRQDAVGLIQQYGYAVPAGSLPDGPGPDYSPPPAPTTEPNVPPERTDAIYEALRQGREQFVQQMQQDQPPYVLDTLTAGSPVRQMTILQQQADTMRANGASDKEIEDALLSGYGEVVLPFIMMSSGISMKLPPAELASLGPANQVLARMYEPKEPVGPDWRDALDASRRAFIRAWTDRGVDLAEWQQGVERMAGRSLAPDEMASELQRLDPIKAAQVSVQEGLRPAIQAVGEDLPYLQYYLTHQDNIDVAKALGQRVEREVLSRDLGRIAGTSDLQSAQARVQVRQRLLDQAMQAHAPAPDIQQAQAKLASAQRQFGRAQAKVALNQLAAEQARAAEAARAGQAQELGRQFSGELLVTDSLAGLRDLQVNLGPERYARVEQAASQVYQFVNQLRDRAVESGLWSPTLADALRTDYPHYVPTRILDHIQDPQAIAVGKSISASNQGLKALTLAGTEKAREQPLSALIRSAYQMEGLARKNEVYNAFIRLRNLAPGGDKLIPQVTPEAARHLGNRWETITGFENGVRTLYAVPKDIAAVINQESVGNLGLISAASAIWRSLVTSRNPVFLFKNAAADFATASIRMSMREGGPQYLPRVVKALLSAYGDAFQGLTTGTYHGSTAQYFKSGGGMFGFFPAQPAQGEKAVLELARKNAFTIQNGAELKGLVKDLLTLKPVEAVGERIELAPRVAQYRLAQARGANQVRATIQGRDVTVDFAQGGTFAKAINQAVPFFNVGIQGAVLPIRAFRENPRAFVATAATLLSGATAAEQAWNNSDPQRAADFADVPQYLKDTGLVFMWPGEAPVDSQGNRHPQFVYVKLREWAPFAVLTREAIQRAIGNDPRSWGDLLQGTAQGIQPVSNVGQFVGIPGVRTGLELGINRDLFRNRNIATERADQQASAFSQALAQQLTGVLRADIRPSQVEFALRELGAGPAALGLDLGNILAGRTDLTREAGAQAVPVAGQAVRAFARGDIGGTYQQARDERLSGPIWDALQEAGMHDIVPVARVLEKVPLTSREQGYYQQLMNAELSRGIERLSMRPKWLSANPDDKRKLLTVEIERARRDAGNAVLRSIPPLERRQRQQEAMR